MKQLLEHLEKMERLHNRQWEISFPVDVRLTPEKVERLLPKLLSSFTEKQLAQELRRRGYIVVKVVDKNDA